jgi:hypothetical protein
MYIHTANHQIKGIVKGDLRAVNGSETTLHRLLCQCTGMALAKSNMSWDAINCHLLRSERIRGFTEYLDAANYQTKGMVQGTFEIKAIRTNALRDAC